MRGRHRTRLTRRGRRLVALWVVAGVAIAGASAWALLRGPGIVVPEDPCTERPPLRTLQGVRLQPLAMRAFKRAQAEAGERIPVVQSYRSCGEQREACRNICGDPEGCPGRCAPAGLSWHQLGAAIDIAEQALERPRIVRALVDNGWCQAVPDTDPGHFSFDGCH